MHMDLYTHAVWTIRAAVVLTTLAFLVVALQAYSRLVPAQPHAVAASVDVAGNDKRDVVQCRQGQVAYVDRQDAAEGCEAVVLHVAGGYVR